MAITEQRILKQVSILPASGAINVQWANQVLRNGDVISETFERKAYTQDQLATFHAEVGTFDLDAFTQGFSTTALDAKVDADAALATAQAEITRLTALIPAQDLPPVVNGVPQAVTMRQARLALLGAGYLTTVTSALAAAGQSAQIEWEYSSSVERNSPVVSAMSTALSLTDDQIDALFVTAAAL